MFQPPETFAQLRALTWAAPLVCGFFVTAAAWGLGLQSIAWGLGLIALVSTGLLALVAVWTSTYGVRHSLVAATTLFLAFSLPLSLMLVPVVAPVAEHGWWPVALAAGSQVLLLALASAYQAYKARLEPRASTVKWPHCHVSLVRRTITKADNDAERAERGRWVSPALIGAASVGLYQLLKATLAAEAVVVVALVVANAMSVWLTTGPIARACGQSFQLRKLERADGRRFVSGRLPWLNQERQRSPFGRWMQRFISPRA